MSTALLVVSRCVSAALVGVALAACDTPPAVSPSGANGGPSSIVSVEPRPRTEAGHPLPPLPTASARTFPAESDRCADTTNHERRPERPCVAADRSVVWTPAIVFETDKSTIRPESRPVLESLAALLSRYPELRLLEIQGHLNAGDGAPYRARRLDADRADEVKRALVELGVDAKRLVSRGFGGEVPLYPPTSDEGKKYNRRVVLVISEVAEPAAPP